MPKHLALPSSPRLEASEGVWTSLLTVLPMPWEPSQADIPWAPVLQARDCLSPIS